MMKNRDSSAVEKADMERPLSTVIFLFLFHYFFEA